MGVNSEIPKSIKGYDILERLAAGGFGVVYRAKQSSAFGREVAIKVILPKYANQPDFIRRFEAEAEIFSRLEHPYIVPLYDFWRDPNGAYLIMRYYKGGSVKDALEDEPYGLEAASQLLNQAALALDFAHRNNVVHRDIKPGNILLDEDGNAYLSDFGIAKDLVKKDGIETDPQSIVGSLDYISPEQARSEPVTGRTDIYSLGVTLYEIITGEHPFKDFSTIEKLYKHINEPLPDITILDDELNDNINAVIHKATAKNPADRYSDTLSFAKAFREAANLDATEPDLRRLEEQLTEKEHEFLGHICEGLTIRQIAGAMFITEAGVRFHRRNAYKKLGVKTRVQARLKACSGNLVLLGSETTQDAPPLATGSDSEIFIPDSSNPYKGLQAFQMSDTQDFFGREKFVERLLKKMQEGHDYQRFLPIVGPSGSGKSSLVKAGLIPAMLQGKLNGNHKWYPVDMLPNNHPIEQLEIALQRVANEQAENIYQHLRRDERGLTRIAELILPSDETELLIYIDQFEETFTLCQDEEERQHFLNLLYAAVTEPRSRIRVIITLRADYYDKPLHYHQFGEMLRNRIETILPLSAKELERAIVGPTERVGIHFETGLVAQIVSEMTFQAAALPLLQYALTELFKQRDGNKLTHAAYHAIGGAVGALANRAEELYQELDTEGRALCKQLFLRLVTLGEGAEDTRRRPTFTELISIGDNAELMEEIIDALADYRLLTLDHDEQTRQPTVEVAHEAILREWERLRGWLNESRDDIREERILAQNADEWISHQRDNGYLLREGQLKRFEEWRDKTGMSLTPLETEFIEASIAQHKAEEIEKAEQLAREEFMQKREIELIRQRLVRTRALVAVFVVAAILSGGLSVFALNKSNEAEQERNNALEALDIAQSSGLAFAANSALDRGELDLAIALAVESAKGTDELLPETLRVLERISESYGPKFWIDHSDTPCEKFSPDHQYMMTSNCEDLLKLWDLTTAELVQTFSAPDVSIADAGELSPNNERLLTYDGDKGFTVWEVATGEILNHFEIEGDRLWYFFAWDETQMWIMTFDRNLRQTEGYVVGEKIVLYDVLTGAITREYEFEGVHFNAASFSQDGSLGIIGGWDDVKLKNHYSVHIFDVETGNIIQSIERDYTEIPDSGRFGPGWMGFSPDNTKIWFGGFPNYIIDRETGEDILTIGIGRIQPGTIDLSFQKTILESSKREQFLVDLATGELEALGEFNGSTVGSNGKLITGADGTAGITQVMDMNGRSYDTRILLDEGHWASSAFSPDGMTIASVMAFNRNPYVELHDSQTGEFLYRIEGHLYPTDIDWSSDGKYLLVGNQNGGVLVKDARTGEDIQQFTFEEEVPVITMRFTPDNRYVVAAQGIMDANPLQFAPYLLVWDLETGKEVQRIEFSPGEEMGNWGFYIIRIHPNGRLAFVSVVESFTTGTSYIVDLETGEIIHQFAGLVDTGDFTPDGKELIIGGGDGYITVLSTETWEILRQWRSLESSIQGVTVSPDGKYLATGSGPTSVDAATSIWDVQTGELYRRYIGHRSGSFIVDIDFSPDGTQLVTSANDATVRLWRFDPQPTLDWILENRAVRDLTCAEKETYRIESLCEEEA